MEDICPPEPKLSVSEHFNFASSIISDIFSGDRVARKSWNFGNRISSPPSPAKILSHGGEGGKGPWTSTGSRRSRRLPGRIVREKGGAEIGSKLPENCVCRGNRQQVRVRSKKSCPTAKRLP